MPNVVGLSKEEAQKEIEAAKLVFEVEKEEYNKDVPEGYVISQNPTYMERFNKVKEKSTVSVIISKGQEKAKVPNVKGKEKEEAIKLIEEAKLKADVVEDTSKTVKEGYVISQETDPDADVFAGDTVIIHVSTGVEKATVPDVVGKTQAEAKKALEQLTAKIIATLVLGAMITHVTITTYGHRLQLTPPEDAPTVGLAMELQVSPNGTRQMQPLARAAFQQILPSMAGNHTQAEAAVQVLLLL